MRTPPARGRPTESFFPLPLRADAPQGRRFPASWDNLPVFSGFPEFPFLFLELSQGGCYPTGGAVQGDGSQNWDGLTRKWKPPDMRKPRQRVLVIWLLLMGGAPLGAADVLGAPETIRVQLPGEHRFRFAGMYAAISKGFYEAAGLDVRLLEGGSGKEAVAEVISGRAEYGVSGPQLLLHHIRGAPVVVLAAVFQHSAEALMITAGSGINRPQDLHGRRVMIRPKRDVAIEALLRRTETGGTKIQRLPHSGDFRDLMDGRVDAMSGDLTYAPYFMERQGVLALRLRPSRYGIDFYGDCLFTSQAERTAHPQRVRAFRQATLRGWIYAMDHPEELIKLIRLRYDPEQTLPYLRFESLVMRQLLLTDLVEMGHMSRTRWQHIAAVYRELDMIPSDGVLDPDGFLFDPDTPEWVQWIPWVLALTAGCGFLAAVYALVMTVFNARLNAQVRERTAALEASNRRLAEEIADRRGAEAALRQSQARYALVIQGSNDGIWDWDLRNDSVYFSTRYKEILGFTDAEFSNETDQWRGRIHPEDYAAVMAAHEAYWRHETDIFRVEYRLRARDGSYRWIMGRGACIWDADGRPIRMAGSHTDITQRKRAEAEVNALRRLLQNIIDSLPSAIIGVDDQGRVTHWNREAWRETGLTAKEAGGRPFVEVFSPLETLRDSVAAAIQGRRSYRDMRVLVPETDGMRHLEVTVSPLLRTDNAGAVIRVDDTTERVRMEEVMIQSEKMMSVGGLAAGMAHEINNPLGTIMANAQLIWSRLSGDLPANRQAAAQCGLPWEALADYLKQREIRRRLDGILEAGERAAEIVENMLRFSRKNDSRIVPVSLGSLVDQTVALAQNHPSVKQAMDGGLEILREMSPELPPVPCAATEIQQVLLNLLINACQAIETGGPTEGRITVRTRREGDWARLDVGDDGPGMEETVRRRVFEPFFTTKSPGLGTGLGLSVAYFIVTENHGGTLTVASAPGHGATFTVRLPLSGRQGAAFPFTN